MMVEKARIRRIPTATSYELKLYKGTLFQKSESHPSWLDCWLRGKKWEGRQFGNTFFILYAEEYLGYVEDPHTVMMKCLRCGWVSERYTASVESFVLDLAFARHHCGLTTRQRYCLIILAVIAVILLVMGYGLLHGR